MEIWHVWVILGIILIIIEIITPGFLFASFGLGAFGGSAIAYLGYSFKIQLLLFSITTLAVYFGIRPIYMKYFLRFDEPRYTGTKALIGKICKVTETVNNENQSGRVQIGGESWKAFSETNEIIKKGELVRVVKIVGVTAHVEKK